MSDAENEFYYSTDSGMLDTASDTSGSRTITNEENFEEKKISNGDSLEQKFYVWSNLWFEDISSNQDFLKQ